MNQFRESDPEWLAHEALATASGNTATAVDRLRMAIDVLLLWQPISLFGSAGPDEPHRGE